MAVNSFTAVIVPLGLALATCLSASRSQAANLLINPGFESGFGIPNYPGGWQVVSEEAFWDCGEAHSGSCSLAAASDPLQRTPDLTFQFFDTVAGQQYAVTFFYKTNRNVHYPGGASIGGTVGVISGTVGTFQPVLAATFVSGARWEAYAGDFTATGPQSRIAFKGLGFADNHHGNLVNVDDVTISAAVPEPTVSAMLLAGLSVVGLSLRRKRMAGATFGAVLPLPRS